MKFLPYLLVVLLFVSCDDDASSDACGDQVVDIGEACDGDDLGRATCADLGYYTGTPSCNDDCTLSPVGCTLSCGDGILQTGFGEECEGLELNGATCESLGYYGGTLACGTDCQYDTGSCSAGGICGDNEINGSEACDGPDLGGETCYSRGYMRGNLSCDSGCAFDESACLISRMWGAHHIVTPNKVLVNGQGDYYLSGTTIDESLVTAGGFDWNGFLTKISADGSELWTVIIKGTDDSVEAIADTVLDMEGNLYLVGGSDAEVLNGEPAIGNGDGFVIKYDPDGNLLWTRRFGSVATDEINSIAVDISLIASDSVFIAGTTSGDMLTGGYGANANQSIWFARLATEDGTIVGQIHQSSSDTTEYARGIVAISDTVVFITGVTNTTFANCTGSHAGIFLMRYDYTFDETTYRCFEGTGDLSDPRLAKHSTGVLLVGTTPDSTAGPHLGGADIFLVKIDQSSVDTTLWETQFGTTLNDMQATVHVDPGNRIYVGFLTDGSLDGYTNAGVSDMAVVKLDGTQTMEWSILYGKEDLDAIYSLADDGRGSLLLYGSTKSDWDDMFLQGNIDFLLLRVPNP